MHVVGGAYFVNKNEIKDLILLKQEGSYWDFKREWYDVVP